MENIDVVKAYYAALDSAHIEQAEQYLSETYQLVGFTQQPMDKNAMLNMMKLFKASFPNLGHLLSNIHQEGYLVKVSVQLSGTNTNPLDLTSLGIGVVPATRKFIIFPTSNYEFTVVDGKIEVEKDVSPASPNRRMSGMLRAMNVSKIAAL